MINFNKYPVEVKQTYNFMIEVATKAREINADELLCFIASFSKAKLLTPCADSHEFEKMAHLVRDMMFTEEGVEWVSLIYPAWITSQPVLTSNGKLIRPSQCVDRQQAYVAQISNKDGRMITLQIARPNGGVDLLINDVKIMDTDEGMTFGMPEYADISQTGGLQ